MSKHNDTFDENTKILTLNIQSSGYGSGSGPIDIYGNPIKNGENIIQIQM